MTSWAIVLELDDMEQLERARSALQDFLEAETGVRPRTRTFLTDSLVAALRPPERFQGGQPPAVWRGATGRR